MTPCTSTLTTTVLQDRPLRCEREEGHGGDHRRDVTTWNDRHVLLGEPLGPEDLDRPSPWDDQSVFDDYDHEVARHAAASRMYAAGAPDELVEAVRAFGLREGVLDPSNGRFVVGAHRVGDAWEFAIGNLPGPVWLPDVWIWTP